MENLSTNLKGLVLCGGQSSRMGSDKGLLRILVESAWVVRQCRLLARYTVSMYVSLRAEQIMSYQRVVENVTFIPDSMDVQGPLNGLLSAHKTNKLDDFLVLACDMISVKSSALVHLISTYHAFPNADVYLYTKDGQVEPMCAIYTAKGLRKIDLKYTKNRLKTFSICSIIEGLDCKRIQLQSEFNFQNYNSPTDL